MVVPNSVILGQLSKPLGAQPLNPWTVIGSVPFIAFAEPLSASSGCWASACLQEEPPSLCAEQEGDQEFPCLFCTALTHPFRLEGGVEYARLPSVGAAVTPPVSCYWVSPSGGPCPIR